MLVSGAAVGFFVGFVTACAFSLRPSSRFSSSSSSSSSVSQSLLLFFDDKSEDEGGAVSSLLSGKASERGDTVGERLSVSLAFTRRQNVSRENPNNPLISVF